MKAAVLHGIGTTPRFEDFPDPVPEEGEVLVKVRAVALENIDRMVAAGTHFAAAQFMSQLPAVVGFDGVGTIEDGSLVGFGSPRPPYGAMAELTVVPETNIVPVPEGIDPEVTVVLATAVSGLTIETAGGFQPGETVLIQGATGVSGRLAVQVARLLGAGRIVATGRDDEALAEVAALGADTVINTAVSDDALKATFEEHAGDGYDVVLDFLWGRPTELLLRSLVPGELGFAKPTRLVQIGESAGPRITLSAESIRTSGVEIYGAIKGLTGESMMAAYGRVVDWARNGELSFEVERVPLAEIESAWQRTKTRGRRQVVIP